MKSWSVRHVTPAFRTYAGTNALEMLGRELARTGAGRVVLVSGASILHHEAAVAAVQEALGDRLVATFGEATEHSPLPVVRRAADLLRETGAQAVVALGGGSAIVTARAASIVVAEGRDVQELSTHRGTDGKLVSPRLEAPKLAQWIIPSTPTTAYAKAGAAVRDPETGSRLALFDPKVRASAVFFSPIIAATAPEDVVRSSALNAFAMAIDGLQSGADDPLAEASLRHALTILQSYLPLISDSASGVEDSSDGESARLRLMFAALLAGQGSDHVGTGLAQPISHAAGPRSRVGNGVVEAMMLPHTMRFNLGITDRALETISALLRPTEAPSPAHAVGAVQELLAEARVPTRLRDVGIERAWLPEIANHVLEDWAASTVPRRASLDELLSLLDAAW